MGLSAHPMPCMTGATMMETRSACLAATVLGIVSPNMSSTMVTAAVATATARFSSAMSNSMMLVAIAAAPVFTRLLPSRMGGSRRSGCSIMRSTRAAPAVLLVTSRRRRTRCTESSAASEPEKNAEKKRNTASSIRLAVLTSLHIVGNLSPSRA